MLPVTYDPLLVLASVAVAMMAVFTSLGLAQGLSRLPWRRQQGRLIAASLCFGGGIWATHFVGMLAVTTPVPMIYDSVPTLASALIAILATGLSLLILNCGGHRRCLLPAGGLTGIGIVTMHFVGMSAVDVTCVAQTTSLGYVLPTILAIGASTAAYWVAGERPTLRRMALASTGLALTIAAMHYSAMLFTGFQATVPEVAVTMPALSNGLLALLVMLVSFVLCGWFLLTATPLAIRPQRAEPVPVTGPLEAPTQAPTQAPTETPANTPTDTRSGSPRGIHADVSPTLPAARPSARRDVPQSLAPPTRDPAPAAGASSSPAAANPAADALPASAARRPQPVVRPTSTGPLIPVESGKAPGGTLAPQQICYVKASGHYTYMCDGQREHFCPWPITQVDEALKDHGFVRVHRSYLVNASHLRRIERERDKAWALLAGDISPRARIPVSRHRLTPVRDALGLGEPQQA